MSSVELSAYDSSQIFDVLVVGGGNAGLCAAMTAGRAKAKVLLLEVAPQVFRGGNSRHTRNLRYLHESENEYLTGAYFEDEFWNDLLSVTSGATNEKLAQHMIRESANVGQWMEQHGCKFQPPLKGSLHLSRTNAFFLGGGKALINAYYDTAMKLGVKFAYEAEVCDLNIDNNTFSSAVVKFGGKSYEVKAKAVVVASGGFEANIPWLKEYWGKAAQNFLVRGCPYNKGKMLQVLIDRGAKPVGDPRQCHSVAIDARAPQYDGGIVTRLDCIPFGIVVNKHAKRFYDEGEDFWPKRYAIWGRLVAQQPDQVAYSIIDAKCIDKFMPSVFPPLEADSIHELSIKLELSAAELESTVATFNNSVETGKYNPKVLDQCSTTGIEPPKSHWALPLDTPPFYAYPLRPGITFTYLGVTINERAQIIMSDAQASPNIFAAGEIMAGNILGRGYVAGLGMTIGTVFGRIAGTEAVRYAFK
jgi:tricarballylate dehydrogenase